MRRSTWRQSFASWTCSIVSKQSAATASQERARYHFDYTRLTADLQRMRAGINDYLTPQRAQPRAPAALQGDYRQDSEQEPKK